MAKDKQAELIDLYGEADAMEKAGASRKKEVKKELGDLEAGTYYGNLYEITVSDVPKLILNPMKVFKKIGDKLFMKVVTVSIEKLKEFMIPADIDKCVESSTTTKRWLPKARRPE